MQSCKEELFQLVILEKAPYTACSWSLQPGVIWQFLSQKIMKYENGPHLRFKEHLLSTSNNEADILSQTSRWSHESIPDVTCRSPKLCQLMMIWVWEMVTLLQDVTIVHWNCCGVCSSAVQDQARRASVGKAETPESKGKGTMQDLSYVGCSQQKK